MDARKAAAAVSAAGAILIAGCAGGKGLGGGSVPAGGSHGTAPANSAKVSLSFKVRAGAQGWLTPQTQFVVPSGKTKARAPRDPRATTQTHRSSSMGIRGAAATRKPKYVSPGIFNGGALYVNIFQGSNLALVDGPFTVGTTYGAYDIYCTLNATTYEYACQNYAAVFAPLGNDTFFVSTVNSKNQLVSVTPGQPGTSFYGPTPYAYTITASGYPYPISIQTYGILNTMALDSATPCADPSGGTGIVYTATVDATGYDIEAPLANPITFNVSGSWNLYAEEEFSPYSLIAVTTPYTIYDTSMYLPVFVAQYDGAAGSVSISSPGNITKINNLTTSMNLYAVDRFALTPSAAGINVAGLVDSGPYVFNCGLLPFAGFGTYGTPVPPFGLTNPVAIAPDDYFPGAVIADAGSGTPYVDLIDLFRFDFGFFTSYGFYPYIPAEQVALSGTPLDVAVSPISAAQGRIYVLNADGSISAVNENPFGAAGNVVPSGTISGPNALTALWSNSSGKGDMLFAASSNSGNIYEIDGASSAPSPFPIPVASPGNGLVSPVTYGAYAENWDGDQYVSFLAFDSGSGNADAIVTCSYWVGCANTGAAVFGNNVVPAPGTIGFNANNFPPAFLAGYLKNVLYFTEELPPVQSANPFSPFGSTVTRIISSYDGLWNGVSAGSSFQFFFELGTPSAGSLAGTRGTIVSIDPCCD